MTTVLFCKVVTALTVSCRQSFKSGRHADARLRKIVQNLRKILVFERGNVKITSFNLIFLILTHLFCVVWHFWHIFMHNCF